MSDAIVPDGDVLEDAPETSRLESDALEPALEADALESDAAEANEPILTPERLASLRAIAEGLGLLRLGAVALDDPGFAPAHAAWGRFLDAGKAGSMSYLERTREVRRDPAQMLAGARTALVACAPYDGEPGPVARYAQGRDYHTVLHQRLLSLGTAVAEALPGAECLVFVDTKPILERAAAALAGLGFLGKHGCLIVPGLGSYVLLGGLLITARLAGPAPARDLDAAPWDACGECRRCLDACPTAAFDGPGDLDPRRCISYLTIEERGPIPEALAAKIGERIAGCDVCQEVCPYNAGLGRRARAPAAAWIDARPGGPPTIDLLRLADLGSSQHRALGRGSALRRIPRRQLRRNALVALGNREGPASPAEAAVILRAIAHARGLVAIAGVDDERDRGGEVDGLNSYESMEAAGSTGSAGDRSVAGDADADAWIGDRIIAGDVDTDVSIAASVDVDGPGRAASGRGGEALRPDAHGPRARMEAAQERDGAALRIDDDALAGTVLASAAIVTPREEDDDDDAPSRSAINEPIPRPRPDPELVAVACWVAGRRGVEVPPAPDDDAR